MRTTGKGIIDRKNHSLYYSCYEKTHILGTGFMVENMIKPVVIIFKPTHSGYLESEYEENFLIIVSSILMLSQKIKRRRKSAFYDLRGKVYDDCSRNDIKFLNDSVCSSFVNYSLHEEHSENEFRPINFAIGRNLILGGTVFKHKNIHKSTWTTLDSDTVNQIDHILIDKFHSYSLLDVGVHRSANADSDYLLLSDHFRELLSECGDQADTDNVFDKPEDIGSYEDIVPSYEEVHKAVEKLKNIRAPETDEISTEPIKNTRGNCIKELT
ncbi:hypothetical protein CWI36_2339p0010, partial [Hamiltosporidium magnivora]